MKHIKIIYILLITIFFVGCGAEENNVRIVKDFNFDWKFNLGDVLEAKVTSFNDENWRTLNLPHDWSVEGEFSIDNPAKPEGGALPTGIAWYRKTFTLPIEYDNKSISIEFDGIYRKSEVWINGQYLGIRPNGYVSFAYDLTDYLKYGDKENVITVKVDNSEQPNSRWYSGSGIYRNVRLVVAEKLHIAHWGTYVTTPEISKEKALVNFEITLQNDANLDKKYKVVSSIVNNEEFEVAQATSEESINKNSVKKQIQNLEILNPNLWDTKNPYLYKIKTKVFEGSKLVDNYTTPLGIRYFNFDAKNGFSLNDVPMNIHGVCLHHDNGALGAVANYEAIKRKLTIMKNMGVNAIRVSHNPSGVDSTG